MAKAPTYQVSQLWRITAWNNVDSDLTGDLIYSSETDARADCDRLNADRAGARHDYVVQSLADAIRKFSDSQIANAMDEG